MTLLAVLLVASLLIPAAAAFQTPHLPTSARGSRNVATGLAPRTSAARQEASLPSTPGGSTSPGSLVLRDGADLPPGITVQFAGAIYADQLQGYAFTSSSIGSCSEPSVNTSPGLPVTLSASAVPWVCLNAVLGGVVSSTWQGNLSSYTNYRNGSTNLTGCAPVPPYTNSTGCPFFASNRYMTWVPIWGSASPTNSTQLWSPGQNGYWPSDLVFAVVLGLNNSTPTSTTYAVTTSVGGATPAPWTYFVRTPSRVWNGTLNVTVVFDMTAAWLTYAGTNASPLQIYAPIGGYAVAMSPVAPCSACYLSFSESGLPAATHPWTVDLSGPSLATQATSTGPTLFFLEPNGTYSYQLVPVPGFTVAPTAGTVTVTGSAVVVPVTFRPILTNVTFTGSGLRPGKMWGVVVGYPSNFSWIDLNSTAGRSNVLALPNGTFDYLILAPPGYEVTGLAQGGTLTVAGSPVQETFQFVRGPTVSLKFTATGLARGQFWCVFFSGIGSCRVAGQGAIRFTGLTPGSFRYALVSPTTAPIITARIGTTSVALNGTLLLTRSTTVAVTFDYVSNVEFSELGLSSGSWSVTLHGSTRSAAAGQTIDFSMPNGTYRYTVGKVSGYTSVGSPKRVKVVYPAPVIVTVTFKAVASPSSLLRGPVTAAIAPARAETPRVEAGPAPS